ncbi:ATP-binding protein [Streptomyces qinglanensis]|uniref:Anti-sigma regulatory factor (Ser/Thr protein kinase) n=1 Tax=Streptomyces qinglanensis TaxID=943816 RepID=A0A1H9S086_9ACTN|nr:ATP-binding protein [Streptomyces qinglanensis]SER77743.1 Anti-sigma regulatory factor (Ser/Thr protein kinase) [Streptomyces qinglanensis]
MRTRTWRIAEAPQRPALSLALLARAADVGAVRHQVAGHCAQWGARRAADAVALCVSELLTNVVVHVGEGVPVTVRITWCGGERVRLAVTDPDPRPLPLLLAAAPEAESGRGVALVDSLALRWGVEQGAYAKTVWCELACENEDRRGE